MDRLVAIAASTICMAALISSACLALPVPVVSLGATAVDHDAPASTAVEGGLLDIGTSQSASLQPEFANTAGDRVFFEFGRFDLTAKGRATLAREVGWLSARRELAVVIAGHCDEREAAVDSTDLAARRTAAVFDYLSAHGVAFPRIRKVSYGMGRPLDPGTTEAALVRNRSAQIILIDLSSR